MILGNNKKVLIIASHFPPQGGGRVMRVLKFVKYLPVFGWQPIVLTPIVKDDAHLDHSLLEEIPACVKIYRTKWLDLYNLLPMNKLRALYKNKISKKTDGIKKDKKGFIDRGLFLSFLSWLMIPDYFMLWIPIAVFKALKLIRNENIDIIYTTSPLHTSQVIGIIIKKITGKLWIADFRDAWTQEPYLHFPTKMHKWLHSVLEYLVFKNADRIITISDPFKENMQTLYKGIARDKISVIMNGYDPEDFKNIAYRDDGKFTITYTGSFMGTRTPQYFFDAINELIKENPGIMKQIRVIYAGWSSNVIRQYIAGKIIESVVEIKSLIKHKTSIEYICNSDVLFFNLGIEKFSEKAVTGKIFEYLYAQRPIIAMTPVNGIAAKIINDARAGYVLNPTDVKGAKDIVYKLYKKYLKGELNIKPDLKLIEKYDRRKLAKELSEELDKLCRRQK